jgi:hypothetical protein
MNIKGNTFIILLLQAFLLAGHGMTQDTFYDVNEIQKIEIYFLQSNWDYQLDTLKLGVDGYLPAHWVKINGVQFDSVGVKYKGTSSYDSSYAKNPLHISLDEYVDQSYGDIENIKLANCYADPSMIREVLAYDILGRYMDCSRSNFAQVYINGAYIGLYSNDEPVNNKFCLSRFSSKGNTFIKCCPLLAGPYSRSNLKFISYDSTDYFTFYELESDDGWNDLVAICDTVTNYPTSLSSLFDLDRVLWMLVFNNVLVNLDSYSGWFSQNHYLYRSNFGFYYPIAWDFNMAFGGFPFAGTPGGGSGSLSVQDMIHLAPLLHATHADWPLINGVLNDASWKKKYLAHMRTINDEVFASGDYLTTALQLQAIIDTAVASDTNKFFSYQQFLAGLDTDVQVGNYMVPGISTLMDQRFVYLASTPEFSTVPPVISEVNAGSAPPVLHASLNITAAVGNANTDGVSLYYRFSRSARFTGIPMADDGLHNDGAAGDGVYGASFLMSSLFAQYYVYAENDEAGAFMPARAEHEYFTAAVDVPAVNPGDVVINEFVASNNSGIMNEYGDYADWIELKNNTDSPLSLYGLYISDDFDNPYKFPFPDDAFIEAQGYLALWADEKNSTADFIHCNFKLSADGEIIMITNAGNVVIDSVDFGPQPQDTSSGRCPNGIGDFTFLSQPSFNYANVCPAGENEYSSCGRVRIFPNPAREQIFVVAADDHACDVMLFNAMGELLSSVLFRQRVAQVCVTELKPGLYVARILDDEGKMIIAEKIIVTR